MSEPADLLAAGIDPAAASTAPSAGWTPPPPEALAGAFPQLEVLALIGRGGMGAVYKARQTHLDRIVALKVLAPERSAEPAFVERFTREARALARLQHPHITTLFDFGRAGDWLYLVMEHVEGANLRQVMATGRLSPSEALRLVTPLCEALAHAHAHGVVHRDLKPENILIDGQGRPRIADFGLAKLRSADGSLTQTGDTLGTLHYMAPEQIAGSADVDHRADVYALGVVLYEMLTGSLPLGRCRPPSQAGADPRLDEVVLKSLEREPGKRWQSADELGRAVAGAQAPPAAGAPPHPAERVDVGPIHVDPAGERVDVGPIHVGPDGVRIGDFLRVDRTGVHRGERDVPADGAGDGERRLFRSGMWLLVGGILLAVWLGFGENPAASERLHELTAIADAVMLLGGASLLLRTGLVVGLAGAIAALLVIPWCWQWHWALGCLVAMIQLGAVHRILDLQRLGRHYASLRWRAKLLRGLAIALLAALAAAGLLFVPVEAPTQLLTAPARAPAKAEAHPAPPPPAAVGGAQGWDPQRLPPGCRLAGDALVVDATAATRVVLATLDASHLSSRRYHVRTQVRWHGVEGKAYLEMWSHFSGGGAYFSRTLGETGPLGYLSGNATEWRETWLPFDATGESGHLERLEIALVLPGPGTVEVRPLQLVDAWPGPE